MTETESLDTCRAAIWKFIRGETSALDFHHWSMAETRLLDTLGEELYLDLIATDHVDLHAMKDRLERQIRQPSEQHCDCITLPDIADIDMGDPEAMRIRSNFEEKGTRGDPYWWLSVARCPRCGQWWLVADEERINDVVLLKRLSETQGRQAVEGDVWPNDFDSFETVIALGRKRGHLCSFTDEHNGMLAQTAAELTAARPDITVPELAHLFNTNENHAQRIVDLARRELNASLDGSGPAQEAL